LLAGGVQASNKVDYNNIAQMARHKTCAQTTTTTLRATIVTTTLIESRRRRTAATGTRTIMVQNCCQWQFPCFFSYLSA